MGFDGEIQTNRGRQLSVGSAQFFLVGLLFHKLLLVYFYIISQASPGVHLVWGGCTALKKKAVLYSTGC